MFSSTSSKKNIFSLNNMNKFLTFQKPNLKKSFIPAVGCLLLPYCVEAIADFFFPLIFVLFNHYQATCLSAQSEYQCSKISSLKLTFMGVPATVTFCMNYIDFSMSKVRNWRANSHSSVDSSLLFHDFFCRYCI